MWGLNKGDWPWLLLGLLGGIVAGGTPPSEGTFIAQVQVKRPRFWVEVAILLLKRALSPTFL